MWATPLRLQGESADVHHCTFDSGRHVDITATKFGSCGQCNPFQLVSTELVFPKCDWLTKIAESAYYASQFCYASHARNADQNLRSIGKLNLMV